MANPVTPEYLLQLFRQGKDSLDIACVREVWDAMPRRTLPEREAWVVKLIAHARDKEREHGAAQPAKRVVLV